ncbi:MAG: hypothetical protein ABI770_00795 [Sphingomicrobium sp.]
MIDPAYESMLERYRQDWEKGQFDRLIYAFIVCAWNDVPVPLWLRDAILEDLQYSYQTRRRGDRSARTGAVQDHWNRVHQTRHAMMQTALNQQQWEIEIGMRQLPLNKNEAAEEVKALLSQTKHVARGSTDAIIESYNSLENKAD